MYFDRKKSKKILLILSIIMMIITIGQIANVYALFYSEAKGTAQEKLGKWYITVNNTDISSGITQPFTINQFNIIPNTHTKTGKFAPSMQGDFEIIINPNDTEVSVRYDLEIDKSALDGNKISIVSVQEIGENNTLVETQENVFTGIISLNEIRNDITNTIKITFNWENDETNNDKDTQLGTEANSKIKIPIILTVSQYLGETITGI